MISKNHVTGKIDQSSTYTLVDALRFDFLNKIHSSDFYQ